MISLQHEGTRLCLPTVQRATCDAGNLNVIDDQLIIKYNRYFPAQKSDIAGIPLAGRFDRHHIWDQETVHASRPQAARLLAVIILNLNLIPAAQIDAAIAAFQEMILKMQLEISELLPGDQIHPSLSID